MPCHCQHGFVHGREHDLGGVANIRTLRIARGSVDRLRRDGRGEDDHPREERDDEHHGDGFHDPPRRFPMPALVLLRHVRTHETDEREREDERDGDRNDDPERL